MRINTHNWIVENGNFLAPEGTRTKTWRQFVIVRGLPSSGKSVHGHILNTAADFDWIEADHMFRAANGQINIIPSQIRAAHDAARQRLILSLGRRSNIVVTNTATRLWEIDSYLSVIGNNSPDCKWKIKVVDLQEGMCHTPSLKVPTLKYLEMALRYEAMPPDWLSRWVNHFNSTRGRKLTDESIGDSIFRRKYLLDNLQTERIHQVMTEAQLNSFISGHTSGRYTSYLDMHSDKEAVDDVIEHLRQRPPVVFVPYSQIEDMLEERNVPYGIRQAVKAVWTAKNT